MTSNEEAAAAREQQPERAFEQRNAKQWKGRRYQYLCETPPDHRVPTAMIQATTEWLNRRGDEGWELVAIENLGAMAAYIFKRPKGE